MTSEHRFRVMTIAIRYLEQKRLIQEADINYIVAKLLKQFSCKTNKRRM